MHLLSSFKLDARRTISLAILSKYHLIGACAGTVLRGNMGSGMSLHVVFLSNIVIHIGLMCAQEHNICQRGEFG